MTQLQCRYLQPSLCQEGFGLIDSLPTLWAFRPSMKLLLCLINSGFVEGGDPHKALLGAGTLLGTATSTAPQSWSHICGKETQD